MANPDTIFYNGKIYARADHLTRVEALAVADGHVTRLGRDEDVLRLRAASVRTVDLKGRVVIPGLADSHIHLLGYGTLLRTLDLSPSRSISDIQRLVDTAAKKKPSDSWIIGRGWDQEKLREQRYPSRHDLDTTPNPVFVRRICGHVGVANSPALALSGITKQTLDPPGGEIQRDPSTGDPTGVVKEKALALVQDAVPQTEAETRNALLDASRRLLALGLTSLHCIIENKLEFKVLRTLKGEGAIPQNIYAILPVSMLEDAVKEGWARPRDEDGFAAGGVKVYLDGSLGARTAALTEPYADEPTHGMLVTDAEELDSIAGKAVEGGFQLCLHAIGDRAVSNAVTTIEKASTSRGSKRHRVEHSSLTPPSLIAKMQKCGVVASVQPRFILSDTWALRRLGSQRINHLYPFRSMLHAGIPLAGGSDCPIEDPNPFEGIWSAVTRPGLSSEERLTVEEALACYTTGAAYARFAEHKAGTLDPGKQADMVILDADPLSCGQDAVRGIQVLETIVAGETAWKRSET